MECSFPIIILSIDIKSGLNAIFNHIRFTEICSEMNCSITILMIVMKIHQRAYYLSRNIDIGAIIFEKFKSVIFSMNEGKGGG